MAGLNTPARSPCSTAAPGGDGRLGARSVLWLIELTLDPAADLAGPFDLRQTLIEHELGDARRGRNFGLEDVGLARKQHTLGAKFGADLVGARLRRDDEALIGDPPRPCGINRQPDCRK